jgi:hypothetical protein
MKNVFLYPAFLFFCLYTNAQVKIGNNPNSIDPNSLLEMESTNKGFLPPRVAINSLSSVSPLFGTVPAGMLVYSSGGTLSDGYYYWNGTAWNPISNGKQNLVSKTATTTLAKTETFVLASNDIILTLPVVTSADDGLEIMVKNIGTHTDLVKVIGNSGATIDGIADSYLTRYLGQTFVATSGNWVIKEAKKFSEHLLVVDEFESWTTLQEVIDFLNLHMFGTSVVRLDDPVNPITSTIEINLPYSLTIQGLSFGTTTISAASGLAGKPMFRCISDCSFKMLQFDATTLTNYGTQAGEDAIRLVGSGSYNEIKDCTFDRFYNTILDSTDAELWLFECDISNGQKNGLLLHSAEAGVKIRISETDFISCAKGVNMNKGSAAIVQIMSGAFINSNSTDTAIIYDPTGFTAFETMLISTNSWNNTGKFIQGFDFSRSDGRDANAFIESNVGIGDQSPSCKINVNNNSATTTITTGGVWYKAVWTNTSSFTTKWTVGNNIITYQPTNKRNAFIVITGNISVNGANKTISIGLVKNGVTTTRIGETDLRLTVSSQPYQFSTVIYLSDIAPGDYFELFCTSSSSNDVVTFQDVQWLTESK